MPISFWQLLTEYNIEIPIIQRDYAQGRIGKEKLREKFLKDLKYALDYENDLKLDFIYGTEIKGIINPLDGQQRLTTLWLLHWYIANKAGKLTDDNIINFKKFTYETRITSREFCEKLAEFDLKKDDNVVAAIENQTWFFKAWKQDPTIKSMLNMLGGTPFKDVKNNELIDGIEELFEKNSDFERYWDLLTADNCPIKFHYLPLNELNLSDDLYIKMNARGKALSQFENFKADLVGFLKKKIEESDNWKNFEANSFDHKLDTDWTNLFWKFKSDEHKIDEIYFAFFNRFFLNELIIARSEDDFIFKGSDWEKSNKTFQSLLNDELGYTDFTIYLLENKNKEIFGIESIKRLTKVLDNFYKSCKNKEFNKLFLPHWDKNSNFMFIPEYQEDGKISSLTLIQRVVFHAICCYFERGEYQLQSLKQWMRVVWNIVENAGIISVQSMIGALRLTDNLALDSHNIYTHLEGRDVSKDFAKDQMEEEKEKAKKISKEPNWEEKIIEAEKTVFFKGAIRFLFRIAVNNYDWSIFDSRFEKAVEYFDENGVKEKFANNAVLLRYLILHFNNWGQFWGITYDNQKSSWKNILLDVKWIEPVNKILSGNPHSVDYSSQNPVIKDTVENTLAIEVHRDLVSSNILQIIEEGSKLHWQYNKYALYPYNAKAYWKKYVIGDKRNIILTNLIQTGIIVECEQKNEAYPYFRGWEIEFKCLDGNRYQWWEHLKIWNELKNQYEDVKDKNDKIISIDNLESYLTNLYPEN
jgi:hypothetical protein